MGCGCRWAGGRGRVHGEPVAAGTRRRAALGRDARSRHRTPGSPPRGAQHGLPAGARFAATRGLAHDRRSGCHRSRGGNAAARGLAVARAHAARRPARRAPRGSRWARLDSGVALTRPVTTSGDSGVDRQGDRGGGWNEGGVARRREAPRRAHRVATDARSGAQLPRDPGTRRRRAPAPTAAPRPRASPFWNRPARCGAAASARVGDRRRRADHRASGRATRD